MSSLQYSDRGGVGGSNGRLIDRNEKLPCLALPSARFRGDAVGWSFERDSQRRSRDKTPRSTFLHAPSGSQSTLEQTESRIHTLIGCIAHYDSKHLQTPFAFTLRHPVVSVIFNALTSLKSGPCLLTTIALSFAWTHARSSRILVALIVLPFAFITHIRNTTLPQSWLATD